MQAVVTYFGDLRRQLLDPSLAADFEVLGSVATAVAVFVTMMAVRAFTVDSRMAEWTRVPVDLG